MRASLLLVCVVVWGAACARAPGSGSQPSAVREPKWAPACVALQPLGVGSGVQAPLIIDRVEPTLTSQALRAHRGGIVIVGLIIDATGNVCDAHVLRGLTLEVNRACESAVRQWRFRPAMLDGHPRAAHFAVTVRL